jgi:F-type H+-transporting ATPase subunit b
MALLNKIFFLISAYILPVTLYAESEKGGMPQLDPSSYTSQTFWLILTFSLLFIFVNIFFFPEIIKVRENREKKINNFLENAKKNSVRSNDIKSKLDQDFTEAKKNADKIVYKSVHKCREEIEKKIELLNNDLEKKNSSLIISLEKDKKKVIDNISEYSFELSNIIYKKLLNEENSIDSKEFKKLLKE